MRVFVSSTFRDLQECREVVHGTLRRLQVDDVAMEYYVAEHERPVDVCLRDVRDCDVYLGIFAWRYGHAPDGHERSITELEYRAAVEAGKPCLIFLLHEEAPWIPSRMDRGTAADRIEALRVELVERHTAKFFHTPAELGIEVATALHRHLTTADDPARRFDHLGPAAVTAYYQRLQKEYGRLDLDALTPPEREEYLQILLESVFVEQQVRPDPPPTKLPRELAQRLQAEGEIDESALPDGVDLDDLRAALETYRAKPARPVFGVISGADRHIVVLGDPGAGKSTLARFVVLDLAGAGRRLAPLAGHLPLLVELRQYAAARDAGTCRTLLEFIDELANGQSLGVARHHLEPYLQAGGPALVVFDGLDEIFDPGRRDETTKEIASFADLYPGVRALVTSRVVGYSPRRLTDAGFAHYTLQDLGHEQISEFLASWYTLALHDRPVEAAQRRDRLLEAVRESRSIGELAGNPLLLTILAIIGKHQTLPRERWEVYYHAARVLVQHWDVNRRLREKRVVIDYIDEDDKRELLRRLAWHMQTKTAGATGNYIHREELHQLFEHYLIENYGRDRADAKVAATVIIDQFQHRNFILSRFGPNLYSFVHRTFLEFFCADEVVRRFQREQSISLDDVIDLYVARRADPTWREVLRLIASVLADHHVGRISSRLLDVDRPWPVDEFDSPPHGLAVAIQCLGEGRSLRANADVAERALTELVLLLEHCVGIEDREATALIDHDLLPTIRAVGPDWPGRDVFADWYSRRGRWLIWAPVTSLAAALLTVLFADRSDVLLTLAHLAEDDDSRASAALRAAAAELKVSPLTNETGLTALGDTWTSRLSALATTGTEGGRYWATHMLDRIGPDDAVVHDLLWDRFRHDDDVEVFRLAATCLLRRDPNDPHIPDTMADRIKHDAFSVLTAAAKEVADRYNLDQHPGLASVFAVRDLFDADSPLFDEESATIAARNIADRPDRDEIIANVRRVATAPVRYMMANRISLGFRLRYNALITLYHIDPDDDAVHDLLWDRLRHDDDDDVFRLAATCLLRRDPNDPHIPSVLADRIERGAHPALVRTVLETVAAHHLGDHPRLWPLITLRTPFDVDSRLFDQDAATAAARNIVDHPHHEEIIKHLETYTRESRDYSLRHNALMVLDHIDHDADAVHDLLWDRLRHDPDVDVFRLAATCLLRRHPNDPHIPDTMAERIEEDGSSILARAGARVAAEHNLDSLPKLAVMIAMQATFDTNSLLFDQDAATAAARNIVDHPHHEEIIKHLETYTRESRDYSLRHNALMVLDHIDHDADAVHDLLWDRLRHDPDDDVFRLAATCLLRRHPNDPHIPDTMAERIKEETSSMFADAGASVAAEHDLGNHRKLVSAIERSSSHLATRMKVAAGSISIGELPSLTGLQFPHGTPSPRAETT